MPIVTMSGTIGSGPREVGRLAAEILGIDYVDRQIMVDAARRLGVSAEALAERDERCTGFRERLANMLRTFLERSATAGLEDPLVASGGLEVLLGRSYAEMGAEVGSSTQELDDTVYMEAVSAIISELGQKGDIVIVGRGSQVILKELPTALHVLTHAPLELCARRIVERDKLTPEEASKAVHESDSGRAAFHRKFFKVDVNDPRLYGLVIDTSRIPYAAAAEIVAVAARAKQS
jgi:cytidylate kinase